MSYADVNDLSVYYEEHGDGDPLILLHGAFGCGELFGPVLPELAKNRRVITVDLQGHGRTADIDRPLRAETLADDVAGVIRHLGLAQADVMGFSLGAGVALRVAIQHPGLVRRLVIVSQPARRNGWYPEILVAFEQMGRHLADSFRQTQMYEVYCRVAPDAGNFPVLLDKVGDAVRQDYDWSAEIPAITAPVMLVYGDADSVLPAHIVEFYALLGGGLKDASWDGSARAAARLAILPDRIHTDISTAPELAAAVIPFLDATTLIPPPMGMP
jgi:pimeloyl-ACP methyl ester carboxylesterase